MMSYQQAIDYLYNRLPMFSKLGSAAIKKDLVNIQKLCEALGNPQNQFKSIHIAGTNGKGSSSHMLCAVFESAGFKTGLYTSPHLLDFRERIRIHGLMLSKEDVVAFLTNHKELIETISPSFFEVTVAMAFYYFAKQKVDIAIIETGLGGRLDSTNILCPILSLITNISLDHTAILGNSISEIAKEKAGIIKPNTPVIVSEFTAESKLVFQEKAASCQAEIHFASEEWKINVLKKDNQKQLVSAEYLPNQEILAELSLDLTGSYQVKNLAGVLSALKKLSTLGFSIPRDAIRKGLSNVKGITGLMGRWHSLGQRPLIICDTGHNESGWKETIHNIESQTFDHLHMVIGVMHDKDIRSLLIQLPQEATYYFCKAQFERALPEDELLQQASQEGLQGKAYTSISEALKTAIQAAKPEDMIFIGGSSFVVAEALELFQ